MITCSCSPLAISLSLSHITENTPLPTTDSQSSAGEKPAVSPLYGLGGPRPNVFLDLGDGTVLIGCEGARPLAVWHMATHSLVCDYQDMHAQQHRALVPFSDGYVASACTSAGKCLVMVYSMYSRSHVASLEGHSGIVEAVAFLNGHLLSISVDKFLFVWAVRMAPGPVRPSIDKVGVRLHGIFLRSLAIPSRS